jgi:hypothetical protein
MYTEIIQCSYWWAKNPAVGGVGGKRELWSDAEA